MVNYELLLRDVRDVSKDTMKKIIFDLEQEKIKEIKDLNLDPDTTKKLILMQKDRTFLEMLLTNSLMQKFLQIKKKGNRKKTEALFFLAIQEFSYVASELINHSLAFSNCIFES